MQTVQKVSKVFLLILLLLAGIHTRISQLGRWHES